MNCEPTPTDAQAWPLPPGRVGQNFEGERTHSTNLDQKTDLLFLRHSGWMVVATFLGSIFMVLVHGVARKMPAPDYTDFFLLVRLLFVLSVPGAALQMVFAREMAAAATPRARGEIVACTRGTLQFFLLLWTAGGLIVVLGANPLCAWLSIQNPFAFGLTILIAAGSSIVPVLTGLLQGEKRFGPLGLLQLVDGPVRFGAMLVIVLVLRTKTLGAMAAVGLGRLSVIALSLWLTREMWRQGRETRVHIARWLRHFLAFALGLGTLTLMYTVDVLFVKRAFPDETAKALYQGAALAGFTLLQLVFPVSAVMFPFLVRTKTQAETTHRLAAATLVTGLSGVLLAVAYTLVPELPLRTIYPRSPEMWHGSQLVPWFAWMFLPLILANLMLQSILARARYRALPWLAAILGLYAVTLWIQKPFLLRLSCFDAFRRVIQTFGLFNVLFLLVAFYFTNVGTRPTEHSVRKQSVPS